MEMKRYELVLINNKIKLKMSLKSLKKHKLT
jgi:hypothetical protein